MSESIRIVITEWIKAYEEERIAAKACDVAEHKFRLARETLQIAFQKVNKATGQNTSEFLQVDAKIVRLTRKDNKLVEIRFVEPEKLYKE